MRKISFFIALLLLFSSKIFAQLGINADNSAPNPSAMLDVKSTNKGLVPPVMTAAQRDAISAPAAGLIVWCSDCGVQGVSQPPAGEMQVYNGTTWVNVIGGAATPVLTIGQNYQGGIIAYILQPGDPGFAAGEFHGLIAATSNQGSLIQWGCSGAAIGDTSTALGTGQSNTTAIVNACVTSGIAARVCNDLVLNGYSDWYLPSKEELNKLYLNRVAIGGLGASEYWSSSEHDANSAWTLRFNNDSMKTPSKSIPLSVRAVRSF